MNNTIQIKFGYKDAQWNRYHLLELNLDRGQVCMQKLNSQTSLVEKKVEEFRRMFIQENTNTKKKHSLGTIFSTRADIAPYALGTITAGFDFFKERLNLYFKK